MARKGQLVVLLISILASSVAGAVCFDTPIVLNASGIPMGMIEVTGKNVRMLDSHGNEQCSPTRAVMRKRRTTTVLTATWSKKKCGGVPESLMLKGNNAACDQVSGFVKRKGAKTLVIGTRMVSTTTTTTTPPATTPPATLSPATVPPTTSMPTTSTTTTTVVVVTTTTTTTTILVTTTTLLSYATRMPLSEQVVATGPVYVTGSNAVSPAALEEAARMASAMLANRPDVIARLQAAGALIAVAAPTEQICELSYFQPYILPFACWAFAGGVGGAMGRPETGCSEVNLLKDSSDLYGRGTRPDGENICVHEFAHTVFNVGVTDDERMLMETRFAVVKNEHILWTLTYALTDAQEFEAEMSQSYFCANPVVPNSLHNGINCPDQLRAYDPATFSILDAIWDFNGSPPDLR